MWRLQRAADLRDKRRALGEAAPLLWWLKQVLLLVFGRPVRCATCGWVAFVCVPVVRRGRLVVYGICTEFIVEWDSTNALRFRHVDLDRCRRP
jgi:hypothetical protein